MSFAVTHLVGFGAGGDAALGITPFSTEYTTPGAQTVTKPVGAVSCIIECIGAGGSRSGPIGKASNYAGGGGGAYSKTTVDVTGYTGIYIDVPAAESGDAVARQNSVGGTIICLAKGADVDNGGSAASGTGDVKYSGGSSSPVSGSSSVGGAGAAGPSGNGSANSGATGGASGGSPGGAGGNSGSNGSNYGGGAGNGGSGVGAKGYIKLSWS